LPALLWLIHGKLKFVGGAMTNILLHHLRRWVTTQATANAPDRQLLDRFARQHDQEAFSALVERHGPMVLRLCRRLLVDDQEADDAFQATFLVLARKIPNLAEHASVAPWLYGVAYRIACRARSAGVRRRVLDWEPVDQTNPGPPAEASWREVCGALDEELQQLPDRQRAPLILCYLQGRTRDEAAQQLGWSLGTLKRRLEEGREALRGKLLRRGLQLATLLAVLEVTANPLPAALLSRTTQTACRFAAGKTMAAAALSARAMGLAEDALTATMCRPGKILVAVALALGVLGSAAVWKTAGSAAVPGAGGADTPVACAEVVQQPAKAAGRPEKDVHGDPLPQGAMARLGTIRWRHGSALHDFAFSPDSQLLVTAAWPGVCLREAATGKELAWFPEVYADRSGAIAFLPDGKSFAVVGGQDGEIVFIDVATRKVTRQFNIQRHGFSAGGIALSADGQLLATGQRDTGIFRVWDMATGKERLQLPVEDADRYGGDGRRDFLYIDAIRFSADSKVLVAAPAAELVRPMEPRFLYRGEVANGVKLRKVALEAPDGFSSRLALAPDGSSVAGGDKEGTVRLLDTATGKERRRFQGGSGAIAAVTFSPDGKVLIAQGRQSVYFWDLASAKEIRQIACAAPVVYHDWETALGLSPDGKTLVRRDRMHALRLWDTATAKEVQRYNGHTSLVQALAFSPDGRRLASVASHDFCLWDPSTGQEIGRSELADREFWPGVAVAADGTTAVAGSTLHNSEEVMHRWQAGSGKDLERAVLKQSGSNYWPHHHSISADGQTALARKREGQAISLWETASGKEISPLQLPLGHIRFAAFAPNGRTLALCAQEGSKEPFPPVKLRLYSVSSGKSLLEFAMPKPPVPGDRFSCGVFSPDGRTLAAGGQTMGRGSEAFIQIWETATGKERFRWRTHSGTVPSISALTFSADGKVLASAGNDDVIRLWDSATGKELGSFQGHRNSWYHHVSLSFAPDGRTLASGGGDGTILIWDTAGVASKTKPAAVERTAAELETLWAGLKDEDSGKTHQAMIGWQASPAQAPAWFAAHLQATAPVPAKRLQQLLADLESDQFAVREKAAQALTELGELAEPELRKLLDSKPALETRQRVEKVLEKTATPQALSADALRALRAVEVLERLATTEGRQVLEKLGQGAAGARLTREANAALDRLGR
jgi:RNA polymerase sigma factor (sigma-70 family)